MAEIGFVGLGRMGGNMVTRLRRGGHRVVVEDVSAARAVEWTRSLRPLAGSTSAGRAPVLALSLQMRFRSRQEDSFAAKVCAALRNEFGGHAVKKK